MEDTISDEEGTRDDPSHRNYDAYLEGVPLGTHYPSTQKCVPGCKRRSNDRLGCTRVPFIEPIGASRERFYEQKLSLALAWYCEEAPKVEQDGSITWTFRWDAPRGVDMTGEVLVIGKNSIAFEVMCNRLEERFSDFNCECCALDSRESTCPSCRHAIGWHRCQAIDRVRWRKGSLHAGVLDAQRVLFNLHRKLLPLEALRERADVYIADGLLDLDSARRIIEVVEQERRAISYLNDGGEGEQQGPHPLSSRLNVAALRAELQKREAMMREGPGEGITDQWRVYSEIVDCLANGRWLRMIVQASAGTGKSLWA